VFELLLYRLYNLLSTTRTEGARSCRQENGFRIQLNVMLYSTPDWITATAFPVTCLEDSAVPLYASVHLPSANCGV